MFKLASRALMHRSPGLEKFVVRVLRRGTMEKKVLFRTIHRGDVVFDIGANVGNYTCMFARLVGSLGEVHAFEPVPPTFKKLRQTVEQNNLNARLYLSQYALADKPGCLTMYMPVNDCSQAALTVHDDLAWSSSHIESFTNCEVGTLDGYINSREIGQIDFVKIDVEGAELLVLQGMESILRRSRPPTLLVEIFAPWTANFNYTPRDLLEFLHQFGYVFYYIGKDGLILVRSDGTDVPGTPGCMNFLCVIPGVHGRSLVSLSSLTVSEC